MSEKETGLVRVNWKKSYWAEVAYGEKILSQLERLQAELAECHAALNADWGDDVMQANLLAKKNAAALALRVKALEDALQEALEGYPSSHSLSTKPVLERLLADSDKTADEVIASFLGEPVGGFIHNDYHGWQQVSKEHENDDGVTKLYAPKVKP